MIAKTNIRQSIRTTVSWSDNVSAGREDMEYPVGNRSPTIPYRPTVWLIEILNRYDYIDTGLGPNGKSVFESACGPGFPCWDFFGSWIHLYGRIAVQRLMMQSRVWATILPTQTLQKPRRGLACVHCHQRKVKCDKTYSTQVASSRTV